MAEVTKQDKESDMDMNILQQAQDSAASTYLYLSALKDLLSSVGDRAALNPAQVLALIEPAMDGIVKTHDLIENASEQAA